MNTAVIVPPIPLKLAISFIIFFIGKSSKFDTSKNVLFPSSPCYAPFWGIAHVIAVHASSVWSERVHNSSSTLLLESAVYHALTQAIVMGIISVCMLPDTSVMWVAAAHCAAHYSWFVICTASMLPNSTLSISCIYVSMLIFCCCTVPYAIIQSQVLISTGSYPHFVAWVIADVCSFIHKHTLAPMVKATPIISSL
jgi:hypothetical protein